MYCWSQVVLSFRSGFYTEMSQQFCTAAIPGKKALTVFGRENDLKTKYIPEPHCLISYECTCTNSGILQQKRESDPKQHLLDVLARSPLKGRGLNLQAEPPHTNLYRVAPGPQM